MFFNKNNKSKKYTVDQALYQIGYGSFQQNISLLSGSGIGLGAFQTVINFIIIPQIKEKILESNKNAFWINPIIFLLLGLIIGGIFWTHIGNKYGRKKASIYSVILNLINNSLLLFIPISFIWISLNSLILGFSIGTTISTDIQIYNDFTLFQEIKSKHLTCILYWVIIGGTIGFFITSITLPKLSWKICILISIALSVTVLISRIKWLFDSPRFLIREHKLYSAADTLYIISEKNKKSLPNGTLDTYSKENVINEYNANSLECFYLSQLKSNLVFIIISFIYSFSTFSILTSINTILDQFNQQQELPLNSSSLLFIVMLVVSIILFSFSLASILPINKRIMVLTSFVMTVTILFYSLSTNWIITLISSMLHILSYFLSAFCLLIQAVNNSSQKYKLSIISMMGYCVTFAGLISIITYDVIGQLIDSNSKLQFMFCALLTGITNLLVIKTRNLNEITRIISIDSNEEFIPKKDKYFNGNNYQRVGNNDSEIKILYNE